MKKLAIVYEDKYLIIVNKDSGLLTINDNKNSPNLYSFVYDYLHKKNQKVYIVHRLDRDTNGLIIFAKNKEVKNYFQNNWDSVIRKYYAIVHGKTDENGKIECNLKEDENHFVFKSKDGKKAITCYNRINYNKKYSLLEIEIKTGRKNQIRVHMRMNNTPIVGDKKYGYKDNEKKLMLCAYYLCFNHPVNNNQIEAKIEIPSYFIKMMV